MIRRARQFLASHGPCAAALVIYALAVGGLLALGLRRCAGHLVYPLDDAYIHMAVARNLARHGVWGIDPSGFTSCVSSLLWPLALAAAALVAGAREATPLILNFICGVLLLRAVWRLHRRAGHPAWAAGLTLALVLVVMPLPVMTVLGMEHVAHALLALAFAGVAARLLVREGFTVPESRALWLLAPLLVLARYESLAVLGAACLLFLCRRRWLFALQIGAWGAAPLAIFGFFAVVRGWHFLPNSVLIKAGLAGVGGDVLSFGDGLVGYLIDNEHLVLPFAAAAGLLVLQAALRRHPWRFPFVFGLIYAVAFLPLYIALRPSLFGRYDAWLDCFGVVACGLNLPGAVAALRGWRTAAPQARRAVAMLGLALLLVSPWLAPMAWHMGIRSWYGTLMTWRGSMNIYEQQYQMGYFVGKYYAGRAVAVNDIGAVGYYGGAEVLDLYGLASMETLRLKRDGQYTAAALERLAAQKKVKVALCYENWIGGAIPATWRKAGAWGVRDSCVCGGAWVTFYAVDPAELEPLRAHLKEFGATLPPRVMQNPE